MTELLPLDPDALLSTTRSVRKRLDFDRPVDPALLEQCLDLALQAPTGSLRQDWHFVVTTDPDQCRQVGEIYKRVWNGLVSDEYLERTAAAEPDPAARASWLRMMESARHLADNFPRIPALMVPAIDGRLDGAPAAVQALKWGSVIQAAWSFMLAGRARGLGTCWTTVHLSAEEEVASVFGIPFGEVQQVALIPVAHTLGTDFKPGRRKPAEQFVHWNGW